MSAYLSIRVFPLRFVREDADRQMGEVNQRIGKSANEF
jgi:hypothetical protein